MKTHNAQNERIKRAYFTYLTEAKGFSEATLDGVAKALNRFETYTRFRNWPGSHGTSPGFRTPMPNISTCRPRRRGSPRPIEKGVFRPLSKSGTSS